MFKIKRSLLVFLSLYSVIFLILYLLQVASFTFVFSLSTELSFLYIQCDWRFIEQRCFQWIHLIGFRLPVDRLWSCTWWTVPQLSIMVIYNSTWSILIQWIRDIVSGDNMTLVYTIETVLSVCDKPYPMNNWFQQMLAEIVHSSTQNNIKKQHNTKIDKYNYLFLNEYKSIKLQNWYMFEHRLHMRSFERESLSSTWIYISSP